MNPSSLFLLSPLCSYITAILNPPKKGTVSAMVMICGFFGFLMSTDDQSFDLYRYLNMLSNADSIPVTIEKILTRKEVDSYVPLSISILSTITDNGHVLMLWFGLIFGFVYGKSLQRITYAEGLIPFLLTLTFAHIYGIVSIAGVRFATAVYVMFLGTTAYIEDHKRKKGIALMLLATQVHFSIIPCLLIFALYITLKNRPKIIYATAILSFMLSFTQVGDYITAASSLLGEGISHRAEIYSTDNDVYMNSLQENKAQTVWFIKYKSDIAFYTILMYFYFMLYKLRDKIAPSSMQMIYFLLTLLTFRNMVAGVPDMGSRYTTIFLCISLYVIHHVYILNRGMRYIQNLTYMVLAGCFFCTAYGIRCIFYYIDLFTFSISPIYGIFKGILNA